MSWLAGWERIEIDGHEGGTYIGDVSWRCALHSTEGLSIEGAVASYRANGVPPQTTIDPLRRRKAQHIDTDRSAYALRNLIGGVETNRWRCIQVEIVMFADMVKARQYGGLYVGDLTDEQYAFIRGCLEELRADKPFSFDGPEFVAYPESYGLHAPQRMTMDEWHGFGGTCGHEHIPENEHGDPGALSRVRLFPPSETPAGEDDMPTVVVRRLIVNPDNPGQGYVLDSRGGLHGFGGAPDTKKLPPEQQPVYFKTGAAIDAVVTDWTKPAGYTLDALGGVFPFGGLTKPTNNNEFYWSKAFVPPAPVT